MAEQIIVSRLKEEQIEAAAELMTRVVAERLRELSFESNDAHRRAYSDGYIRVVRYCFAHGEPYAASIGNKVVGLAPWMPPHAMSAVEEEKEEFGMHELPAIFEELLGDVFPVRGFMSKVQQPSMKQPYWYLPLGVHLDPDHTGRGIGAALLRPILLRADEGKVPCYIETIFRPMVEFCQKHGFEILTEGESQLAGIHYWTLLRPPRV